MLTVTFPGNYVRLAAILMRVPLVVDHWHGFTRFTFKRKVICPSFGALYRPELGRVPGRGHAPHK